MTQLDLASPSLIQRAIDSIRRNMTISIKNLRIYYEVYCSICICINRPIE